MRDVRCTGERNLLSTDVSDRKSFFLMSRTGALHTQIYDLNRHNVHRYSVRSLLCAALMPQPHLRSLLFTAAPNGPLRPTGHVWTCETALYYAACSPPSDLRRLLLFSSLWLRLRSFFSFLRRFAASPPPPPPVPTTWVVAQACWRVGGHEP